MSRLNLARYRIEKAREILKDAEDAIERGRFMLSVNRSYYVMLTAARALLALEEKDSSKHSGVISLSGYAVHSTIYYILCLATYNHFAWYRMTIYSLLHQTVEE